MSQRYGIISHYEIFSQKEKASRSAHTLFDAEVPAGLSMHQTETTKKNSLTVGSVVAMSKKIGDSV
jgi:hypothetical protein